MTKTIVNRPKSKRNTSWWIMCWPFRRLSVFCAFSDSKSSQRSSPRILEPVPSLPDLCGNRNEVKVEESVSETKEPQANSAVESSHDTVVQTKSQTLEGKRGETKNVDDGKLFFNLCLFWSCRAFSVFQFGVPADSFRISMCRRLRIGCFFHSWSHFRK